MRGDLKIVIVETAGVATFGAIVAAIAHFTVRDAWPVIRTFWYALPPPVIAVVFFLAALVWMTERRWRSLGVVLFGLAILFAYQWRANDFQDEQRSSKVSAPAGEASSLRLLFWNSARPGDEEEVARLTAAITKNQADVIMLVETRSKESKHEQAWREGLEGYEVRVLPRGLLFASRHPFRVVGWEELSEDTTVAAFQVQLKEGRELLRLVLADVDGNPLLSRKAAFEGVIMQLEAAPEPALVAGDFNTPRRSVYYEMMEGKDYRNAFEVAGSGYAPTWPLPFPVMMLDQIWLRDVDVVSFRKEATSLSDHEMLIVDLGL